MTSNWVPHLYTIFQFWPYNTFINSANDTIFQFWPYNTFINSANKLLGDKMIILELNTQLLQY